jgi:outer membrane receptor for ferric coprogen and ferric-rhodotorulic acid
VRQRGDGSLTLAKATPAREAAPPPPAPAPVAATMQQVEVLGSLEGDDPDDPRSASRSRGATRLNLSLRETPQSVTVIGRQRIEDQRLATVQDVIGQTTGITLDHASTSREGDQIYARGFAVDTFLVDGVPASRLLEPTDFDTAIYERIEVLRGAAGLVSGTGNPAAAVNLVRKRPAADTRIVAEAQAGSWDRYRVQLDAGGTLANGVRGRVVAARQDHKSFVDRFDEGKNLLYGIVEADLGPATLLAAGFSWQDDRLEDASRRFPSFYADGTRTSLPRSTNSASRFTYYDRRQSDAFASVQHEFDNAWTAKATLSRSANQYDAVQAYAMRGYLDRVTGSGLSLWITRWNSMPVNHTADAYASGPFTLFGRRHEAVFGATASRVRTAGTLYPAWILPGYDAAVPNFYTWNGNSPTPVYDGRETGTIMEQERQAAAYGTLRLRPVDRLQVIAGVRVVNWTRDTETVTFGAGAESEHFAKHGQVVPYAGVTWEVDRHWSAYASYTNIFSPQTYRDRGNRLIDPLEGNNAEAGMKGSFHGGLLNVTAALFRMQQDNLAEIDVDRFLLPDGSNAYHTVSGATARGVELELNGQVRPGWQLTAGYSHAKVEDRAGRRLQTGQPRNNVKLWTTYDWRGVTLGGGVNWQGEVYQDNAGPNGERFDQPGYALVNLMARCKLGANATATVNVNNVLDKRYYSSASGGFYGDPANVMVSLAYRFR